MTRKKNKKLNANQREADRKGEAGSTIKVLNSNLPGTPDSPSPAEITTMDDVSNALSNERPAKKPRLTTEPGSDHHRHSIDPSQITRAGENTGERIPASRADIQLLPPELQHLHTQFEFTSMSVNTSSKMEPTIRHLLERLGKFSFADINAKPGVVVLTAQDNAAAKLVSIVEIAKQAIAKEKQKWYQYSRVYGKVSPFKEKPRKRRDGGKTLQEWQIEQKRSREESPGDTSVQQVDETKLIVDEPKLAMDQKDDADDADDADEMAFEPMGFAAVPAPNNTVPEDRAKGKVRAVPIMTIYMSRVPVPALKVAFDEQTNS